MPDRHVQRTRIFPRGRNPPLRASEAGQLSAQEIAVEVAGWAGASLILLAYLLLSAGRLTGQSAVYQGMNFAGAAGFIVNGWWHGAIPSVALNVIWMMIGTFALLRLVKKRRATSRPAAD